MVGVDPARIRLLSCGCCGTRWRFARTGCPFCKTDSQRLASVAIEEGQGHETQWLSDWSSLHLDVIAHDRGLKRLAASLYDFESARDPA
jgi:FdhE protein